MEAQIQNLLAKHEELILVTDTDLGKDGRFGQRWLAVTPERVMVFSQDGRAPVPDLELRLEEIEAVKPVHRVGQLVLEAELPGKKVEILRCTSSLAERFAEVAKALSDARKNDEKPSFAALENEEERHCRECGRLLPERGSFCPACLKKHKVVARFWKYIQPHWPKALVVSGAILVGTAISLVPPYLIGTLVDDVLAEEGGFARPGLALLVIVAGLVSLQFIAMGLQIVRGRLSAWLGARIMHDVRFELYQAIQGLTLRRYDKTHTGALMSRLTGDTMMLNDAFIFVGFMAIPSVLQLLGICVILIWLDWKLGLLVLIPAPLVVALTRWFYFRMRGLYHHWWQRRSRMRSMANDSISGMRVVKAFSQEPQEIDRFGVRSQAFYEAGAIADAMWATAMPILTFVTTFGTFFVWYFGGLNVLHDTGLTLGTLLRFIMYLSMFYGPLQMLTRLTNFLNRAFTAAQRLFEIMDTDQEVYDDPNAKRLDTIEGAFELEDVHFGYVPDKAVLKGVTADVKAGEMIGLVGPSGVGKTTMINLICRFYDVDDGAIRLDGVDLRNIRLRDLRKHIGIVPQESYLFHGTIFQNIAYAKPDATKDEVIQAAIAANAHGFILRQPDGYDTRVGERGAKLSGGERQRVAIARAILHNPKVLILDEATSSVDTETEELIQEALRRLVKNRTTFAIAHRLSTLRNADRLLVLEDGKVAEFGTHEELLNGKGAYHRLVEMQSKLSAITAIGG